MIILMHAPRIDYSNLSILRILRIRRIRPEEQKRSRGEARGTMAVTWRGQRNNSGHVARPEEQWRSRGEDK